MEKFIKEDWKFKLIMMIVAAVIGIGSYFNYKADNAAFILELFLVTVTSVIMIGLMASAYYKLIKQKAFDVISFGTAIVLSVLFDVLAHLIF